MHTLRKLLYTEKRLFMWYPKLYNPIYYDRELRFVLLFVSDLRVYVICKNTAELNQ